MTQTNRLTAENSQQVTKVECPLGVIRNPSTEISLMAGETFTLSVTVANKGNQSVILDLTIEDTGEALPRWCLSPHTAMAIEINQSREVIFEFLLPLDAIPQIYSYTLKLDSPRHYREQLPIFYRGTLRVLPPIEQIQDVNNPSFTIHPLTDADNPLEVQGGELIPFEISINNRSSQVDRFYLSCGDLAKDWFKIVYPEIASQEGVITANDGLELNPGQSGQIQFYLTLPPKIKAGRYSPTLQVLSANYQDNLVLLDLIYLKVPEIHQLELQLFTQVGTVIDEKGWFEIRLHNLGNATRELQLDVIDTEGDCLCQYILDRSEVTIQPQEETIVNLHIQPPSTWQRPFSGRAFNFTVEVRDTQGIPLPISQLPGILLWKPRPWWHLYLLILGILLLLGGLIGLTWWLLTKKPPQPQVISFTPQSTRYNAVDQQVIRLNWQIAHPEQLAQLQLVGVSPEGQVLSQEITYDFSEGIPDSLKDFCSSSKTLLCTNVPTDAFQAGDYQFQLTLIPQGNSPQPLPPIKTNLISIAPIPKPSILAFTAAKPTDEADGTGGIKLNWKIDNFRFVKQLELSVRSTNPQQPLKIQIPPYIMQPQQKNPIPLLLQPYCQAALNQLVCYDVPIPINQVGKFVFKLTLTPVNLPPLSPTSLETDPIEIKAKPIPLEILQFEIDGKPAPPSYRVNLRKQSFISLLWRVKGGKTLKVELNPVPGTVKPSGGLVYPLSQEPKTETVSLTASDEQGQKQTRSVTIETYLPPSTSVGTSGVTNDSEQKTGVSQQGTSTTSGQGSQSPESGKTQKDVIVAPPPPMISDPQFR